MRSGAQASREEPPHIFSIAAKAFQGVASDATPQNIVINGESGAGKTETTKHLISSAVYTLLTEPDAADQYRGMDDDVRGIAVDELLRYCAPVQMTKPRHAREDLEFHGLSMKRGERLVALLAAANIDQRVFEGPRNLDLTRRPNRHLGWGGGPHICLGLHLARAEAQAALDCLLDGWPGLALGIEPEQLKWIPRSGLRGLKQLPVIFG